MRRMGGLEAAAKPTVRLHQRLIDDRHINIIPQAQRPIRAALIQHSILPSIPEHRSMNHAAIREAHRAPGHQEVTPPRDPEVNLTLDARAPVLDLPRTPEPGDGVQSLMRLPDLSTLVVPDLYVPEPLPEALAYNT